MNNINIIGTICKDIELKYLPSSVAIASFSIAVNQDYKKQDGTKVEKTSFFDVKVIGKQSETVNKFFNKGSRIGISGELEQETWKAQDGTNRNRVVIKLQSFTFIDKKSNNSQTNNNGAYQQQQQYNQPANQTNTYDNSLEDMENSMPTIDIDSSEIPF